MSSKQKYSKPAGSAKAGESAGRPPEYDTSPSGLVRRVRTNNGGMDLVSLASFNARIVLDRAIDDGSGEPLRTFELEVWRGKEPRRSVKVSAAEFGERKWVDRLLGAGWFFKPNQERHALAAIHALSTNAVRRTAYGHTGWCQFDRRWHYLHAGGAIGADGPVSGIETDLSHANLAGYALPAPSADPAADVRAVLGLLDVAPLDVTVPVFAAVWRAAIGDDPPFSVAIVGPSGNRKTALAVLAQRFFGAGFDYGNLPETWDSTENAIEGRLFYAKDALVVVDDYRAGRTRAEADLMSKKFERVGHSVANRQGRERMRPDGTLRPSKPPRGFMLSTGEDLAGRTSSLARLFVLRIEKGSVDLERLTEAQQASASGAYARAMAAFVRWLAPRIETVWREWPAQRAEHRMHFLSPELHPRTPEAAAELMVALECFLEFAQDVGALTRADAAAKAAEWGAALMRSALAQAEHQQASDPVDRFHEALRSALRTGRAYLADRAGQAPAGYEIACGWRKDQDHNWQAHGDPIGWINPEHDEWIVEGSAAYRVAAAITEGTGDRLTISPDQLWRQLAERKLLAARDGKHLKVKRSIAGTKDRFLVLRLSALLELGEPQEDEDDPHAKTFGRGGRLKVAA